MLLTCSPRLDDKHMRKQAAHEQADKHKKIDTEMSDN